MSINKLAVSAVNGALEIQPALANINFDFSLWKVTPPKEFEGVGAAMTTHRRNEAENGCAHRTARKLGALFEKLLPATPSLLKAYGQRASEISKASSIDDEARAAYGVFASRVGPDATSLWAAATSGSSAIAVHLLACMLARIWEASEATSIWVEITERRIKEVQDGFNEDDISDIATLAAAQQDLTRSQIAEWDASARAWLRVADAEKCRQQKQLMLILENVQTPVNRKTETYVSVVSAWKNALIQMEGLINGVSQQAQRGDIVLGLSAWHLYPDLMVVAPRPTSVRQRDPLFVQGGVLTIGLINPEAENGGVHWSLPLAHLRHYGAPVMTSRSINGNERSRISTSELLLATLGCVLQGWGETGNNTVRAVTWLNDVFMLLEKSRSTSGLSARILLGEDTPMSWFSLLLITARKYVQSQGDERKTANRLIFLGRKHGKRFLDRPAKPLFGLLDFTPLNQSDNVWKKWAMGAEIETRPSISAQSSLESQFTSPVSRISLRGGYVSLIRTDDDKIHFLRNVAQDIATKMTLDATQIFIRYKRSYPQWSKYTYEYTTALPWHQTMLKRKFGDGEERASGHMRWLYKGGKKRKVTDPRYCNTSSAKSRTDHSFDYMAEDHWSITQHRDSRLLDGSDLGTFSPKEREIISQQFESRKRFYACLGEWTNERENELIGDHSSLNLGIFWENMGSVNGNHQQTPWYQLLYGDEGSAGLFVARGLGSIVDRVRTSDTRVVEFYALFEADKIDAHSLSDQLRRTFSFASAESDPHLKALRAVSTAAALYQKFPNTTVDLRVLQQPLWKAAWVQTCRNELSENTQDGSLSALRPYQLDRASAFACVAMFESGIFNINPSLLERVIALSSSDSIYIGGALLSDPQKPSYSGDIRRVLGNIGRSGMAFLVPPVDPMILQANLSDWSCIDRDEFDGEMYNCFESTSLHLSFTGATTPVNMSFSGGQDVDAYMLETLISVRDGGKWIADLDIFKTIRDPKLQRVGDCEDGNHNTVVSAQNIIAIDNWLSLIDAPEAPLSIVRAHKNWQARLAATTICIARGYETVVVPDKPCWHCFNERAKERACGSSHNVIIIG